MSQGELTCWPGPGVVCAPPLTSFLSAYPPPLPDVLGYSRGSPRDVAVQVESPYPGASARHAKPDLGSMTQNEPPLSPPAAEPTGVSSALAAAKAAKATAGPSTVAGLAPSSSSLSNALPKSDRAAAFGSVFGSAFGAPGTASSAPPPRPDYRQQDQTRERGRQEPNEKHVRYAGVEGSGHGDGGVKEGGETARYSQQQQRKQQADDPPGSSSLLAEAGSVSAADGESLSMSPLGPLHSSGGRGGTGMSQQSGPRPHRYGWEGGEAAIAVEGGGGGGGRGAREEAAWSGVTSSTSTLPPLDQELSELLER